MHLRSSFLFITGLGLTVLSTIGAASPNLPQTGNAVPVSKPSAPNSSGDGVQFLPPEPDPSFDDDLPNAPDPRPAPPPKPTAPKPATPVASKPQPSPASPATPVAGAHFVLNGLSHSPLAARYHAATSVLGTRMFVVSGLSGNSLHGMPQPLSDSAAFDTATGQWSPIPPSPLGPRGEGTAATVGDKLIVWGGWDGHHDHADGAIYDAIQSRWNTMPDSPLSRREMAAAAAVGNKMVVWGGWNGDSNGILSDGAAFDPNSRQWNQIPGAPLARYDGTAVGIGQKLIVWGGMGERGSNVIVEYGDGAIFDFSAGNWSALPPAPLTARAGHVAVAVGDKMIVWGGTGQSEFSDGAIFDVGTGKWSVMPASPLKARSSASAVAIGTTMVVWGGVDRDGNPLGDGAAFDLATNRWILP